MAGAFLPGPRLGNRSVYKKNQWVILNFLVALLKAIKKTQVKLIFITYFN